MMFGSKINGKENAYNYNDAASVLQPLQKKEEQILYASGDGNSNESIIEKLYHMEDTATGKAIAAAHIALLLGGVLVCILGHEGIGLLMIALFILIPIVGLIVLIIMYCVKPPSANCAITDKRVISMIGTNWDEIALKNVSDTSVRNGNMIVVRTRVHSAENTAEYIVIYKVHDPLGVKQLLDEAVQRAKINEYQN